MYESVSDTVKNNKGKLAAAAGIAAAAGGGTIAGVKNAEAIQNATDKVGKGISAAGTSISNAAKNTADTVSNAAKNTADTVSDKLSAVGKSISNAAKNAKEAVTNPELHKTRKGLEEKVESLKNKEILGKPNPEDIQKDMMGEKAFKATKLADEETQDAIKTASRKAGRKLIRAASSMSEATAAAISAGIGAKTILEHMRRLKVAK